MVLDNFSHLPSQTSIKYLLFVHICSPCDHVELNRFTLVAVSTPCCETATVDRNGMPLVIPPTISQFRVPRAEFPSVPARTPVRIPVGPHHIELQRVIR